MNASMVRFGGIAIFVMFVLSLVGGFAAQGKPTVGMIFGLINAGLLLFAMWTTKGYFNAKNYTRADTPIMVVMAVYALSTVFGLVTGSGGGMGALSGMGGGAAAFGIMAVISLIILLVALVFMLIFALRCMDFGKSGGGGLWKAIGILYLVSLGLVIAGVLLMILGGVTSSFGLAGTGILIAGIGALVMLAALICHGIGLITGAGKMAA